MLSGAALDEGAAVVVSGTPLEEGAAVDVSEAALVTGGYVIGELVLEF